MVSPNGHSSPIRIQASSFTDGDNAVIDMRSSGSYYKNKIKPGAVAVGQVVLETGSGVSAGSGKAFILGYEVESGPPL